MKLLSCNPTWKQLENPMARWDWRICWSTQKPGSLRTSGRWMVEVLAAFFGTADGPCLHQNVNISTVIYNIYVYIYIYIHIMYYLLIELCVTVYYMYIYVCIYIYAPPIYGWLCNCKDISADLQLPPWIGGRAWPQSCRIKDVHVRLYDACSYAYLCNIMQYIYTHNTMQYKYDTIRYDMIWYNYIYIHIYIYIYIYMIYIYIWYIYDITWYTRRCANVFFMIQPARLVTG